jgi:uncharacterized damage-inducible protein DinB
MAEEMQELGGGAFERLRLRDTDLSWVEVTDARVRHTGVRRVRMRGVELQDLDIDGELENVVVNGVDVAPLVEAELARRDPDYALMKPGDAAGFRQAWDVLERRWAATVAHARALDPRLLHERVDGEWSFVETLRHLCYATDCWVGRVYLGVPEPWSPLDLPFDTRRDLAWPHERDIAPSLDEVLALRADRQATVRRVLADLTDEGLSTVTTPVDAPGWPPPDSYPVSEVLSVVLNEEWHHRRYAERDLAALEGASPVE